MSEVKILARSGGPMLCCADERSGLMDPHHVATRSARSGRFLAVVVVQASMRQLRVD